MPEAMATKDGKVVGVDIHIVLVPSGSSLIPIPMPHPFNGTIDGALASTVRVNGQPVAVTGSTASNQPGHMPTSPGVAFQKPPTNRATLIRGSGTVFVNGQSTMRKDDVAITCNDPADQPVGQVVVTGTVRGGG